MEQRSVAVTFTGGAMACLGYTLLCFVLALFIVPTAWGVAAVFGWWCASLRFEDDTRAEFTGAAGRVWPLFAVAVFLSILPGLAASIAEHSHHPSASLYQAAVQLALLPLAVLVNLHIFRWIFGGIRLEPGGTMTFSGRYLPYLGWTLACVLSVFTIIGWAWAYVGLARWFCRNLEGGDGYGVEFAGTGWSLLWHSVLWLIGIVLILPIPWTLRYMFVWWTENLRIIRRDPTPATFD